MKKFFCSVFAMFMNERGNIDLTGANVAAAIPVAGVGKVYLAKNTVTIPVTAVSTNVFDVMDIKANTLVLSAWVKVATPATATTMTADLGITGADNCYGNDIDLESAAATVLPAAVLSSNRVFATAAPLIMTTTVDTLTVAPVLDVYALCVDLY